MSKFTAADDYLSRLPGRPTLRTEWIESEWALEAELHLGWYPRALTTARRCCFLGAPLVVVLALMEMGPTGQERFMAEAGTASPLAWLAGDLVFLVFCTALAAAAVYVGRHLPTRGWFPQCYGCGRPEEARLALAENRDKCRRCLRNLHFDEVVVPRRRALRSL